MFKEPQCVEGEQRRGTSPSLAEPEPEAGPRPDVWQNILEMVFQSMHVNGYVGRSTSIGGCPAAFDGRGQSNGSPLLKHGSSDDRLIGDRDTEVSCGVGCCDGADPGQRSNGCCGCCCWHQATGNSAAAVTATANAATAASSVAANGSRHKSCTCSNKYVSQVSIDLPMPIWPQTKFPEEKLKTLAALGLALLAGALNALSLAIVHERFPDRDRSSPLPDIVFDLVPAQDWALSVAEFLIVISVHAVFLLSFLHRHRFIVLRRCFLIFAVLYVLRGISMFVTQVPIASTTYYCSPKANSTRPLVILNRVVQLVSGFGMSMSGQQTYCGDYIFSGHTVVLTMSYLFIKEYSPKRCFVLHWMSWLTSVSGVILVVVSRGHYTIDVLIAYYVTTRVFYIYHTMANNPDLQVSGSNNYLSRVWWFILFDYFERNVRDRVPRKYEWPLPWPRRLSKVDRNS